MGVVTSLALWALRSLVIYVTVRDAKRIVDWATKSRNAAENAQIAAKSGSTRLMDKYIKQKNEYDRKIAVAARTAAKRKSPSKSSVKLEMDRIIDLAGKETEL